MTAEIAVGSVNVLEHITKDLTLPKGYAAWAIRTVRPDFTSKHGFIYPFPGHVAKAPGPINLENMNACPWNVGDGICAAFTWAGMASGGLSARTLLLIAFREADVLGRNDEKVRLRRLRVVVVLDGERVIQIPGADLYRANLSGADLYRANLYGANLYGAYLSRANLYGANLSGADLSRANLSGADLSRADLSRANLSGADLSGANLSRANLYGADLSGANLSRANLYGAIGYVKP